MCVCVCNVYLSFYLKVYVGGRGGKREQDMLIRLECVSLWLECVGMWLDCICMWLECVCMWLECDSMWLECVGM
jgi:hypothetical protein